MSDFDNVKWQHYWGGGAEPTEPTWTTADGRTLKLKDMPIGHLMNVYKFLDRMRHTAGAEKRLDLRKLLEVRDEIHRRGRRIPPAYVTLSGGEGALRKLVDELLEEQAQLAVEMQAYRIQNKKFAEDIQQLREQAADRNRRVDELLEEQATLAVEMQGYKRDREELASQVKELKQRSQLDDFAMQQLHSDLHTQLRRVRELDSTRKTLLARIEELKESATVVEHGIFPPRFSLADLSFSDGDSVTTSRTPSGAYKVTVQRKGSAHSVTGISLASFADAAEAVVKHEAEQARERAACTLAARAARAFEDKKQSLLERNAERTRLRLDIEDTYPGSTNWYEPMKRALLFLLKQPIRE